MKKVLLSLAVVAVLTIVSCKKAEEAPAEAVTVDTTAVIVDTTAVVVDSTTTTTDTTSVK
ncbi:hypothetical protein [Flavobacterium cellulosilyticum]|uniref:Uncharacterized protein n=1 Tax=Flavobacterium cellulosilyticum TaxID=2541731 RepID=A0A4R5C9D4_9FLAO|nr:hypothetical protein [Flavobacterium cellulosilyticum]TDD96481.1 hypothetical protein E0F76_10745 [Flavobacterium cellulosilyticum]